MNACGSGTKIEMRRLHVSRVTVYRYAKPVAFEHRMMFIVRLTDDSWSPQAQQRFSRSAPSTKPAYPNMIEEVRFAGDSPLEGEGFEPSVPETDSAFVTSAFRSLNTHPRRGSGSLDRGAEGSNRPPSTGDLQPLGPSRDARPEDPPSIRFAARLLELSAAIEPLSNARWRTLISCWKAAFRRAGKKPGIPSK